ncbi:hypothetical protein KIN20_027129 [Parelaphostrongylus tenuis]|uniref:Uncharacterized protein n=1 Tax=Parelaphostrongylus tenuis TaxID=148309 RepID=A0AAD5QYY3_PARTN|nr:hypothetical protein KIN20_027129 [Parelaphostrongylus tenuis]
MSKPICQSGLLSTNQYVFGSHADAAYLPAQQGCRGFKYCYYAGNSHCLSSIADCREI